MVDKRKGRKTGEILSTPLNFEHRLFDAQLKTRNPCHSERTKLEKILRGWFDFLTKKMPERGTQASRKRILQFFNQNLQLTKGKHRAKTYESILINHLYLCVFLS